MEKNFYEDNRKKFSKLMDNNSFALILAKQMETGNTNESFKQDSNFFYFTGLETPNSILLIHKNNQSNVKSYLFIERTVEELVDWVGEKMSRKKASNISGVQKIYFLDDFERKLNFYANSVGKLYFDYKTSSLSSVPDPSLQLFNKIKEHYPGLKTEKPTKLLQKVRFIKEDCEVENIVKAIEITHKGINSIFSHAKPGMMEYELEAYFRFESLVRGKKRLGFEPIVASGVNSTILHYSQNNCKIDKNDLVLLDLGAQHNNYSADISRTFPINGKFTKRQKAVYEAVLDVQKQIINYAKPGLSLQDLQQGTIKLIKKKLVSLKLIEDEDNNSFRKYYMHSISHHLGLDTHDLADKYAKLEAGNVITVEPGIYIKEEKIGVRIEDDILITDNGCRVLSEMIPKEIDQLENLINN